jgi:enolase
MSAIVDIVGREILDSRGNPTVECDVLLESGTMGRAAVPSGRLDRARAKRSSCATATARATSARAFSRRSSMSIPISAKRCSGLDASEQAFPRPHPDRPRRHRQQEPPRRQRNARGEHGGARAAAEESGLPLYRYFGGSAAMQMPVPMMNVVNGGAHANNNLDLQELMIIPVGAPSFREAVRYGRRGLPCLKKILHDRGISTAVGDEAASRQRRRPRSRDQMILEAIEKAGYAPGSQIALGLDCAASEFYRDGNYRSKARA